MKEILLIAALMAMMVGVASAELDTVWVNTYGGAAADGFRDAIPTSDGGFIAVGYTYSFGAGDVDVFAVKTDAGGDTLWARTFGGPSPDYGHSVCEAGGGDYLIAGYTMSSGRGGEDVYLIKIDAAGDTLWTRTYGGPGLDEGRSVCLTGDGHILVAGQTQSYGAGESDVYLLKIDAAGDTVWTRFFGGAGADWAESVCEMADGSYGISGTTGTITTTHQVYALKVDPSGSLAWDYGFGSIDMYRENYGMRGVALADSGMVAAGWRTDQDHFDPCAPTFLRLYSTGLTQSYRRYIYPFVEYWNSVCVTADDGFLMCGAAKSSANQRNDLFLVKRIQGLGWVWDQTIGGAGSDWGCSAIEAEPGYYIISGYTESSGSGSYDGWLLFMREAEASVPPAAAGRRGAIFLAAPNPNPFRPMAALRFSVPRAMQAELAVYDITGRRVVVLVDGFVEPGEHAVTWYGRNEAGAEVSPGMYVARLVAGGSAVSRKLVRLK